MDSELPPSPPTLVELAGPSRTAVSMLRAAVGHGGPDAAAGVRYPAWRVAPGQLAHYREVVGSTAAFPLPFPALVATAAHRDLMGSGKFAAKPLGIVHAGSQIGATGPLRPDEPWDVRAWVGETRAVKPGQEIDLWATANDGAHQWWVRVIVLSRDKQRRGVEPSAAATIQAFELAGQDDLPIPEDTGRSYAHLAGDYNPFHLHAWAAKPFGFSRAIAHGWWLTAAIAARLGRDEAHPGSRLTITFKRPVLLPSDPVLEYADTTSDGTVAFALRSSDHDKQVLLGGSVR